MDEKRDPRADMPNLPCGIDELRKRLDSMPAVDVAEEFERVWDEMDEDTYDGELLRVYMETLNRKAPMPEMPDVKEAYARLNAARQSVAPEKPDRSESGRARPFRFALRVALAAAIAVAVIFGALITAQAAGVDVFGSIARWTEETFSFGNSLIKPADDVPRQVGDGETFSARRNDSDEVLNLQDTLDEYGIVGIKAPDWIPDGYELESVLVNDQEECDVFTISAVYRHDEETVIRIFIDQRPEGVFDQFQKDEEDAETFESGSVKGYIVRNDNNYALVWQDAAFEYSILGKDVDQLKHIVESMLK